MKTPQVPRWMRNLMMGIIALIWISPTEAKAENIAGVSFQVFYDELMPYGDWVKDARYGYVWLPAVQSDFHPYGSDGHWVMTTYGNTWVSDYDWGWATFHYGRWYFDDNYQSWAWIPDYDWGPAWVDWRTGGGYYGWAPMSPGFTVNLRINMPTFYWVFVPQNRFVYHNVYSYCIPRARRVKIYNNTTIINNTIVYNNNRYYAGPARREVERVTKRSYPERRIENSRAPGRTVASRNAVSSYRPELQSARGTTTAARPARVLSSGQNRTQPAKTPSRTNSRSESVSGRSASTPAGSSRSTERTTTPSRSENSGVRSATPSSTRGGEFQTKSSSGSQTRTSTPSREGQVAPGNSRSSETRSAPTRTQKSSTPTPRSSPARTQNAPAQRSTPSRTQPSQPAVKRNAPVQRSNQSRTQQPAASRPAAKSAPARSAPKVKSSPSRSSTPAKSSRTSSGSSSSRSGSKTRGNN